MTKLKRALPYLIAFGVPPLVFLAAICLLPCFGNWPRSILFSDPTKQYLDFLSFYKRLWSGEESWWFSFQIGAGAASLPLIAYYLLSPFNLLVLLIPNAWLAWGFLAIMLLKIGTIGLVAYWYGRRTFPRLGAWKPLAIAFGYALSAYVVAFCQHFEWLDGVILLPIVAMGVERIVRGGKPWLYLGSLALGLLTNYYIGYMLCGFAVLWLIYQLLLRRGSDRSQWRRVNNADGVSVGRILGRFSLASLLAGGLAMIILVPTLLATLGGSAGRLSGEIWTWEGRVAPEQFILQVTNLYELGQPLLFVGTIGLLLVVCFFCNRKIMLRQRLISAGLLLVVIVCLEMTWLCGVWHGGSIERGAPFRFAFIGGFILLYLAAWGWTEIEQLQRKVLIPIAVVWLVVTALVLPEVLDATMNVRLLAGLGVMVAGVATIYVGMKRNTGFWTEHGLWILALVGMGVSTVYALPAVVQSEVGLSGMRQPGAFIAELGPVMERAQEIIEERNGSKWYRMEKTFVRSENDSIQLNYRGLSHYTSTTNGGVLFAFGVNREGRYAVNTISDRHDLSQISLGTAAPMATNTLLGVQYLVTQPGLELEEPYQLIETMDGYSLYYYPYAASLGMVVDDAATELDVPGTTSVADGEVLGQLEQLAMIASVINGGKQVLTEVTEVDKTVENLHREGDTDKKDAKSEEATITYTIDNPSGQAIYYQTAYLATTSAVWAGRTPIQVSEVLKWNDETQQYEHLTHLPGNGYLSLGNDSEITIQIKVLTDEITLDREAFFVEDAAAVEDFYQRLQEQPASFRQVSPTHLEGEVDVTKDGQVLLLTIPYDEGWQMVVDGAATPTQKVLNGVMAVELTPGEHRIELVYQPRGWWLGCTLSAVSLLGVIAWWGWTRKARHTTKPQVS